MDAKSIPVLSYKFGSCFTIHWKPLIFLAISLATRKLEIIREREREREKEKARSKYRISVKGGGMPQEIKRQKFTWKDF